MSTQSEASEGLAVRDCTGGGWRGRLLIANLKLLGITGGADTQRSGRSAGILMIAEVRLLIDLPPRLGGAGFCGDGDGLAF
jgi:hypothetical protein